ncbi:chorismate mutase [Pseudomonas japonica]|uniref:chorismate mutase n=1 Tax=Pseudomonas japonica TaxID=256466 RepID=A0A239GGU4_9PSED|nr:chorismate mutase [Pseudomonas japonica]
MINAGEEVVSDVELTSLRQTIDELDEQLVILLARRFQVTEQVGRLKARQRWQAVDPEREARQRHRYLTLAGQHGLDQSLTLRIFRSIIDEVVRNHRAFIGE